MAKFPKLWIREIRCKTGYWLLEDMENRKEIDCKCPNRAKFNMAMPKCTMFIQTTSFVGFTLICQTNKGLQLLFKQQVQKQARHTKSVAFSPRSGTGSERQNKSEKSIILILSPRNAVHVVMRYIVRSLM